MYVFFQINNICVKHIFKGHERVREVYLKAITIK